MRAWLAAVAHAGEIRCRAVVLPELIPAEKVLALPRGEGYIGGMADVTIGLADAIAALRKELLAAMSEGNDAKMRFRMAPVDLSLQVGVTKEAEGKVGWHVLGLGGSYASVTTQTLALRLEPVWRQQDGSYTADFTIADQSATSPQFGPRASAG
jgi:hypothetical protein